MATRREIVARRQTSNARSDQNAQYMMDEDAVEPSQGRISHMTVFQKIQNANANVKNPEMRLQHCYYVQSIGRISAYGKLLSSKDFYSEFVEKYVQSAILNANVTQLLQKREEFAVIEDDFGSALNEMLSNGKRPCFKNLVAACRKFDDDACIQLHLVTIETSHLNFTKRGINEDEAKAYAFAIAFYSGAYSEMINLNANLLARCWQKNKSTKVEDVQVDDNSAIIMYYLVKGLSHIPFHWGRVIRYVNLKDEDFKYYQPGEIVTWLQFSSSDKGDENDPKRLIYFKGRNTKFIIYSLTGRSIKDYSNCSQDEDEVLFLPHSTFLVCYSEVIERKTHIYMRQVQQSFILV